MTKQYTIEAGRSSSIKKVVKRVIEVQKAATQKKVYFAWDKNGPNSHDIKIESDDSKILFEETVLSKGLNTVKQIHAFLDIFETELAKIP